MVLDLMLTLLPSRARHGRFCAPGFHRAAGTPFSQYLSFLPEALEFLPPPRPVLFQIYRNNVLVLQECV